MTKVSSDCPFIFTLLFPTIISPASLIRKGMMVSVQGFKNMT